MSGQVTAQSGSPNQSMFLPQTKASSEECAKANYLANEYLSSVEGISTKWTIFPTTGYREQKEIVVNDPQKISDFHVSSDHDLNLEVEGSLVIDRNINMDEKTIHIAARCMIIVAPNVTVRAKEIVFRSADGCLNLGRLEYGRFEDTALNWSSKGN